jgi:hypothetical protein
MLYSIGPDFLGPVCQIQDFPGPDFLGPVCQIQDFPGPDFLGPVCQIQDFLDRDVRGRWAALACYRRRLRGRLGRHQCRAFWGVPFIWTTDAADNFAVLGLFQKNLWD